MTMKTLDISQKDCDSKRPIYDEIRVDPLLRKISKHSVGFYIFKVDENNIEPLARDQFGTFYDENVYIIYASSVKGSFSNQNTISREIKAPVTIERFIHVWLGANSSAVKSKHAAMKIIELDLSLGHTAVQYRETQNFETKRFLAYFKEQGFQILSGTNSKSTPELPRLYQVIGRTCPRCIQMKSLSWIHFNSGNVMILQTNRIVFVWVGRSSGSIERVHALNVASKFRERQMTQPEIVVVDDGYEQSMSGERKVEWNSHLNLSDRLVVPLVVTPSATNYPLKLYRCKNVNGLFRAEHIKTDAIVQSDLSDKNSSFIIDGGVLGIWIWIGRNVSKSDKAEGMRHLRGYMIKRNHPSFWPVCRVIDSHEPTDFISLFPRWSEQNFGVSNRHVLEKLDATTLTQRPEVSAKMQLIDDGSGELKVYRIDADDITDIPKRFGQVFYSDNCYIIHYQTNSTSCGSSIKHLIYLWIGRQSKQMDRTTGEMFLTEMFDHFKTSVGMIRIHEGFEPPHFLQLFKGKFIILAGPDLNGASRKFPQSCILKVVGNSTYTAKAIQVTNKTPHSPNDCYIIKVPVGTIWVWCGHSSTGDTREIAKCIAGILGEPNLVMEGGENEEFLESAGDTCIQQLKLGRNLAENTLDSAWEKSRVNLYLSRLTQGQIQLEAILAFNQMDLTPENIYILDAGSVIYVWLGSMVDCEQKQAVWIMALHLISIHPIPRNSTIPIAVVKQGFEPTTFIGFFDKWDTKLFESYKTFDKLRFQMNLHGAHPVPTPRITSVGDESNANEFDRHQKYPIEMLRGDPFNLPTYINPSRKEIHLTHDDFVSVFKMEYSEFEVLPKWRQTQLKKEYKLF